MRQRILDTVRRIAGTHQLRAEIAGLRQDIARLTGEKNAAPSDQPRPGMPVLAGTP